MEVMQRAVVKSRTLKPLPGEITDARIRDATLPLKVEAARRAIAACTDLPELLKLKDQAEGLAAAVRIMKTVGPEMIRNTNCLLADAWRKGGELLSAYSSVSRKVPSNKTQIRENGKFIQGSAPPIVNLDSPRRQIIRELELKRPEATAMVRIASAPATLVAEVVQKTRNVQLAAARVPIRDPRGGKNKQSDSMLMVMSGTRSPAGSSNSGLNRAKAALVGIPLDTFAQLTPEERKIVKAKITEIVELLDEMDRLCR